MSRPKITLIGAGPVGCLLAIHFSKHGHEVEIFERRPDLRTAKIPAGRSINLALSLRGISALRELGIDKEILSRAIPMHGRMMHAPNGDFTFQRYGVDDSQYINSISRGELNRALLNYAEKNAGTKIHFNCRITRYDPNTRTLAVIDESQGTQNDVLATTVIGTDGSASALRESLRASGVIQSSEENFEYGYKELTIPAAGPEQFAMQKNALHIWPRGTHMLIALPNHEGSFTCTLFLPSTGFEELKDAQSVRDFFEEHYRDARALIPDLETAFFENPTGHLTTVRAHPWHLQGQALLVGDAAHAIVPFFGQGLNCGFEDCSLIGDLLNQGLSLDKIFADFDQQRKGDADAIADLALDNFVEMRDKVAQPQFLLEKSIEKILMQRYPDDYVSRYSMVTFSRVPYRLALRAGQAQDAILHRLAQGLKHADEVDLKLAKSLIDEQLAPIMKGFAHETRT